MVSWLCCDSRRWPVTRTSSWQMRKSPKDSQRSRRMDVEEQDVSDVMCRVKSTRGLG